MKSRKYKYPLYYHSVVWFRLTGTISLPWEDTLLFIVRAKTIDDARKIAKKHTEHPNISIKRIKKADFGDTPVYEK